MPVRPRQNPDDVDRSPRAHPRRDRHAEVHAQAARHTEDGRPPSAAEREQRAVTAGRAGSPRDRESSED